MTCKLCKKEYSPECDYKQGRCPGHPALLNIDNYQARYYNLLQTIKGWFKK